MDEPVWLTRAIVEAIHTDQIREHGGKAGLRDEGLLESALARSQHLWAHDQDADIAGLATEYAFGLARNHAFFDGNKRIAFISASVFLILNGFEIEAPEPVVVDMVVRLASGKLSREQFRVWLGSVMRPYNE